MLSKFSKEWTRSGHENANDSKPLPKDAQVIQAMLHDAKIEEYEPRVLNQLLDFTHSYISTLLKEALVLSKHAKKDKVDIDDVRLAMETSPGLSLKEPPTRGELQNLAEKINAGELKPVPKHGLRLPPERFCSTAPTYKLRESAKTETITKPEQVETIKIITTTKANQSKGKSQAKSVWKPSVRAGYFSTLKQPKQDSMENAAAAAGSGAANDGKIQVGSILKTSVKPAAAAGSGAGNDGKSQAGNILKTSVKPGFSVLVKNAKPGINKPSSIRGVKRSLH